MGIGYCSICSTCGGVLGVRVRENAGEFDQLRDRTRELDHGAARALQVLIDLRATPSE